MAIGYAVVPEYPQGFMGGQMQADRIQQHRSGTLLHLEQSPGVTSWLCEKDPANTQRRYRSGLEPNEGVKP